MNRKKLPYRNNCEGYFFLNDNVLAKIRKGYIEFPGGGFNEEETPEQAILRETKEETGAIIKDLKKLEIIYFDWDENWAKTEKQKARYNKFRGEEMHLFTGMIKELKEASGDKEEKGREEQKLIKIKEAIKFLENLKPFPKNMKEYYSKQLNMLKEKL